MTREKLEQLSEEELQTLYQQKKTEYDQKLAKNRRVRGILSRKIDEKQKSVKNLKDQISGLLEANPDLKLKYNSLSGESIQDFDDTGQDPKELQSLIQEKQKTLSQLQSKKLHIDRDIAEISKHITQQKKLEVQLQQEIASMISQPESSSDTNEDSELIELNQLLEEIKLSQEEITNLTAEIEDIREKIHQKG